MDRLKWKTFLTQWRIELVASNIYYDYYYKGNLPLNWLGFQGATNHQLDAVETRLNVALPFSYREFLSATNGWSETSPHIDKLCAAEEITWFLPKYYDWVDNLINNLTIMASVTNEDYFIYGEEQDSLIFRAEYLKTALAISEQGDHAIFLLNPQVVTPNGEWEAWLFADWMPGAVRYPSFWDLMQAEYLKFLNLLKA